MTGYAISETICILIIFASFCMPQLGLEQLDRIYILGLTIYCAVKDQNK